jgi:DNA (cytosine-5)-methyltransferase 1
VTAADAIGDMLPIKGTSVKRGARRFDQLVRYRTTNELTAYQTAMRQWPGFESAGGIRDHVIRYLPRDHLVFAEMRQGAEYPEAHATAVSTAERESKKLRILAGTKAYEKLYSSIVPPYDVSKFPNRWWKLRPDWPVRTLMAHIGKDTYSHIHWDADQARTISVREAARLQSFPDGFIFQGAMNAAFRQVGNAVPPLMANCIAEIIRDTLTDAAMRLAL